MTRTIDEFSTEVFFDSVVGSLGTARNFLLQKKSHFSVTFIYDKVIKKLLDVVRLPFYFLIVSFDSTHDKVPRFSDVY